MTETQAGATTSPTGDFDAQRPLRSFFSVTGEVLRSPARFFSGIRREGSLRGPVLYTVISAALLVPLAGSYDVLLLALRGNLGESSFLGGLAGLWGALLAGLLLLIFSPLVALLGLYVGSAINQILVRVVVGRENAGYYATFRVGGYLSAIALLTWIPVVGLLAGLWGTWVGAVGLGELHGTTTARALIVSAVPYAVSVALMVSSVANGETTAVELLLRGGITGGFGAGR